VTDRFAGDDRAGLLFFLVSAGPGLENAKHVKFAILSKMQQIAHLGREPSLGIPNFSGPHNRSSTRMRLAENHKAEVHFAVRFQ
jgi:hypothetical protein